MEEVNPTHVTGTDGVEYELVYEVEQKVNMVKLEALHHSVLYHQDGKAEEGQIVKLAKEFEQYLLS